METTYLLLGFMSSMALWVAALGTVFAFIFTFILAAFSVGLEILYPMMFGAITGFLLGWVNGFIMGIVTHIYFRTLTSERKYRFAMLLCSLVTTIVGGLVLHAWAAWYAAPSNPDPAFTLSIAVVAAIATAIASQRVAGWYLKHPKRTRNVGQT